MTTQTGGEGRPSPPVATVLQGEMRHVPRLSAPLSEVCHPIWQQDEEARAIYQSEGEGVGAELRRSMKVFRRPFSPARAAFSLLWPLEVSDALSQLYQRKSAAVSHEHGKCSCAAAVCLFSGLQFGVKDVEVCDGIGIFE